MKLAQCIRRMFIDFRRASDLLYDAFFHNHDPVGERHRLDLVVGHIDRGHRQLVAEILNLRPR